MWRDKLVEIEKSYVTKLPRKRRIFEIFLTEKVVIKYSNFKDDISYKKYA